ncbi:DUF2383 domain-containing protein [Aliikangiella sp. IMCC44359]|uniref:DUF2383 domain-containing protein n=1 Tax=Aliikangiella sp. IMCC44359 TaxID=3459125 RepID=UPI00403AF9EA
MSQHSQPQRSDTHNNANSLNQIYTMTIESCEFYHQAAKQVSSQTLRNTFKKIEKDRREIINRIYFYMLTNKHKLNKQDITIQSSVNETTSWYNAAKSSLLDYSEKHFLQQLITTEKKAIQLYRMTLKIISQPNLISVLSSKIASIQISYDKLKFFLNHTR